MRGKLVKAGVLIATLFAMTWYWYDNPRETASTSIALTDALDSGNEAFARAMNPRSFHFPADHGSHPEYKTEWWYINGNLESGNGRRFGYQLTFFRIGLAVSKNDAPSAWTANQFYMAHAALSDITQQRFFTDERFARDALDLAGAQTTPFLKVWLEDWQMRSNDDALFPLSLHINTDDFGYSLELNSQKPFILQGENGLSRKGAEPGNASYYYSYTRMQTQGTVTLDGRVHQVNGESWLDREWSSSVLPPGVEGWDWFSIQLDNQTELMFYRLRTDSGNATEFSQGSLVLTGGLKVNLEAHEVNVTPTDWWQSPVSNIRYPIAWKIEIPGQEIALEIKAAIPNQELNHSVRYWEGSIDVSGAYKRVPVKGRGYLELAGYKR